MNYATQIAGWAFSGHYGNDAFYQQGSEAIRQAFDGAQADAGGVVTLQQAREAAVAVAMERTLREHVDSAKDRALAGDGVAGDLLGAALQLVDWQALAAREVWELAQGDTLPEEAPTP